jgi:non-ribosomal peptide synthetase component E (peptide arylation enzyme)
VALIDGERRLRFADWDRLAAAAARGLLGLGVRPGDVVAYQLPNWWEAAVVFLAAARLGAVVNPVLPMFRERELAFILRQSGASVLVIPGEFRGCDYPALVVMDHVLGTGPGFTSRCSKISRAEPCRLSPSILFASSVACGESAACCEYSFLAG